MRRIFKETKIIISRPGILETDSPLDIIQAEAVGDLILLEIVPTGIERDELTPMSYSKAPGTETQSELLDKIEEFKNTTLNHDPFGDFDGWTLGQIMEDENWDDWSKQVVKEMKNKFIKERVQFLRDNAKKGQK